MHFNVMQLIIICNSAGFISRAVRIFPLAPLFIPDKNLNRWPDAWKLIVMFIRITSGQDIWIQFINAIYFTGFLCVSDKFLKAPSRRQELWRSYWHHTVSVNYSVELLCERWNIPVCPYVTLHVDRYVSSNNSSWRKLSAIIYLLEENN